MIVGYARVSTDGQTLDSQIAALGQAGANKILSEKIRTERKALARAIAALGPGDCLLVIRLVPYQALLLARPILTPALSPEDQCSEPVGSIEAPISVGVSFLWFWPLSIPLAAFEFCSGFGD